MVLNGVGRGGQTALSQYSLEEERAQGLLMLWNKKSEVAGSVSVRCKCVTRPLGWSKLSWGAR